jgi:hypothetical protein
MAKAMRTGYVAECFWAGIQDQDLHELDRRIERSVAGTMADPARPVRYLGWLLVLDDEVLLVLFEGPMGAVRRVAEHAQVPFERLLQVSYAPRPHQIADEEAPQ